MPHLYADVRQDVNEVRVFMDDAEVGVFPAANSLFSYDLSNMPVGSHRFELTSMVNDPVWGVLESARSSPLDVVRPGIPPVPATLRLAP